MVHPGSRFAMIWNIFNITFIVISMLLIPFKMAFDYQTSLSGSSMQVFWAVVEWVIDW
jgi:hypothetical protein